MQQPGDRRRGGLRRGAAMVAAVALVATACGGDDGGETATGTAPPETATAGGGGTATGTSTGAGDDTATAAAGGEITTDVGVTDEPCPDAVDPEKGCIYLGILSDLTEGPFASLAVPITDGQKAFWARVNEEGGIAGRYEVDVTEYTRDNKYNPEVHNQLYQEIKPNVLALAQTLGSPTTAAILEDMKANDVVGAPASWTSLWEFEDVILESGNPYCIETMNALDYLTEQESAPQSVMAVHYPGDYGEDGAAGAKLWADANGAQFTAVEQIPKSAGGTTTAAVQAIVQQQPDVVIVTTGPTEAAEIVGGAAQGYQGRFIGNSPSWNPGLLQTAAADAFKALFWQAGPWQSYDADTPGHQAMREWVGQVVGQHQGVDGYISGWAWSYPLLAALEAAAEAGDLTRAGVVAAISQLESVDYEGILPEDSGNFAGEPDEQAARSTVISQVDDQVDSGVSQISDGFYTGPMAQDFQMDGPCYQTTDLG